LDGFLLDVGRVSLAERQNNKRLDCRWNCGSISLRIGTQISGQLGDVNGMMLLLSGKAQDTVAIRQ
jgi:hypothetical protein